MTEPFRFAASTLVLLTLVLVARWGSHRVVDRVLRARSSRVSLERVRTLSGVLKSSISSVLVVMAASTLASRFGWDLAPLLTGAGVAGVALSLGAQLLVRDFISGIALLLDGQFVLGDEVLINHVRGTVEQVSLRYVRVRDPQGVLWTIPSGEIRTLGAVRDALSGGAA
jgi:small conductance mechanosensitive channel